MAHESKSGFGWLRNRLKIILCEDIGLANPNLVLQVSKAIDDMDYLYQNSSTKEWEMALAYIILSMCRSKKSRIADHFKNVVKKAWEVEIEKIPMPDYALDKHTTKGCELKRGTVHFIQEGAKLENETTEFEDNYKELCYEKVWGYEIKPKDLEKWVWKYFELGLSIFPIKYKDKSPPQGVTWKQYQTVKATQQQISNWLQQETFSNIAVIGGKVSGNLVIFDFDDPKVFEQLSLTPDNLIKHGAWVTKTSKGYHVFFRHNKPIEITRVQKNGIDMRCNTVYVLVYPSIHPLGSQYNLLNTHNPNDLQLPKEIDVEKLWMDWNDKLEKK